MQKVVNNCKATNTLPPIPYDASVDSCPSYHTKRMCNECCSCAADHKGHTVYQDDPLGIWAAATTPLPEGSHPRKLAGEQSNRSLCHQYYLLWRQHTCHHQSAQVSRGQRRGNVRPSLCRSPPPVARSFPPIRPVPTNLHRSISTSLIRKVCPVISVS